MRSLAVLGAGGHGRSVADAALQAGWREVVFFDDRLNNGAQVGPWRVVGGREEFLRGTHKRTDRVVAIGENRLRLVALQELTELGAAAATVLHPRAIISPFAIVGPGSVILAGGIINAFAKLGRGCIVNTAATVDHDCEIEDGVHVGPGAHVAGEVRIRECSWVGIGACIRQRTVIGRDVTIGAGAAVVADVSDRDTVVGVPARSIGEAGRIEY